MQIFVKLPCGENITLDVNSEDTIEAVKAKINNTKCFAPGTYKLYYGTYKLYYGTQLLEESQTIGNYAKENEFLIRLVMNEFQLNIQYDKKTLTTIHVGPEDTISKVNEIIQEKVCGLPEIWNLFKYKEQLLKMDENKGIPIDERLIDYDICKDTTLTVKKWVKPLKN